MDLFASSNLFTPIPIEDGELGFLKQLDLPIGNDEILARLIAETAWRADSVTLWGKSFLQPRLSAWHGDRQYTYSGLRLDPLPFTALQLLVKEAVEAATGYQFNSLLLNYYRDGRDSMGMHSDAEAELGANPVIASVSFGEARTFIMRHRRTRQTLKLVLDSGSLLLMGGKTQHNWLHGINKSTRPMGPRVNLTFRRIA